ncbi:MAG: hypothetical protein ACRD3T_07785 [Terriglobia bacterium]
MVTSDYTIRYQGKIYQIARADIRAGLRGGPVRVAQRLDGSLAVKFREHYVSAAACPPQPKAPPPPKPVRSKRPPSKDRPHLDERLQPAEEPSVKEKQGERSKTKAELLTVLRTGTFYFALTHTPETLLRL